jgi:arsenite methyltransferase
MDQMSMTEASAGYFEKMAGEWDRLRAGYYKEELREAALARAYLRPEMVVADVGSGTGFIAAGLAPLVKQVYALDGSEAMLEVARANLRAFPNVVCEVADGTALPLEDGSLDAVFANMYLHHCADPLAAIREMVRILRPGGRLVITDMEKHDHEWMRQEMADQWLGFERSELRAWLRAAGLVNVIVDCGNQSCCAQAPGAPSASAGSAEPNSQAGGGEARAGEADCGETRSDEVRIDVFVATGSRRVSGAREAVQASYGAAASAGSGPCGCGAEGAAAAPDNCCSTSIPASDNMTLILNGGTPEVVLYNTGYTPEQLATVPAEAASLSLGCGNPTALASLKPGEVVLDIGSGAGIDVFYAARRVGPAGRALGLDMTPEMIERARRSAAEAGLANVEFRLGQAEAMPVEDGSVDVILSNCVINLAEDKGRVFEEAYRVLKEGGRLSISDMVSAGPLPADLRGDPRLWVGCINGALPEAEYLDLVRQAGFVDVAAWRTLSGGAIAGVPVYSLAVSGYKRLTGQSPAQAGE